MRYLIRNAEQSSTAECYKNWPIKNTDQESAFTTQRFLLRKERAFEWYIICGFTLRVKQTSFLKFWLPYIDFWYVYIYKFRYLVGFYLAVQVRTKLHDILKNFIKWYSNLMFSSWSKMHIVYLLFDFSFQSL